MIAKIAVSNARFSMDKPYSYRFGPELPLVPGMRVMVPFGAGNRMVEGIVLSVEQGSEEKLKTVSQVLDPEPVLDGNLLRLAAFVRERYFCTFYEAVRSMLPAGLWYRETERFALIPDAPWEDSRVRDENQKLLCACLRDRGGEADSAELKKAVPDDAARETALKALLKKKWIRRESDFLRRTGDNSEQIATLAVSAEEARDFASSRPRSAVMQRTVLELV